MQKMRELGTLSPKRAPLNPSSWDSGNTVHVEAERMWETEKWKTPQKQVPLSQLSKDHKKSETEAACLGPTRV